MCLECFEDTHGPDQCRTGANADGDTQRLGNFLPRRAVLGSRVGVNRDATIAFGDD